MSANRKRQQFNDRVNEKHERKALKEEETRLLNMQKPKAKKNWKPMLDHDILADMDFVALETRIAAYYPNALPEGVTIHA